MRSKEEKAAYRLFLDEILPVLSPKGVLVHNICPVCGREGDEVQNDDPTFSGGANKLSLEESRVRFRELRKQNKNYRWINTLK